MKELICIICPRGCRLSADEKLIVKGNKCPKGEEYAKAELTHPERFVTSTVAIKAFFDCRLPVKTNKPVPKEQVYKVMDEIRNKTVVPPKHIGDIIIENVLGLGVDVIATKNIER